MNPKDFYKLSITNDLDHLELEDLQFLKDLIKEAYEKHLTIQELLDKGNSNAKLDSTDDPA